jgi:UDP-N-acetyl-D-glucosamine dehydrogenase
MRESPALDVMGLLHERGARISYVDPFVPTLAARSWKGGYDLESGTLDPVALADVDCVAILTDHRIIDYPALAAGASLIVDTRNAIKSEYPHVFRLGAPRPPHAAAWAEAAAGGVAAI